MTLNSRFNEEAGSLYLALIALQRLVSSNLVIVLPVMRLTIVDVIDLFQAPAAIAKATRSVPRVRYARVISNAQQQQW